MKKIILVTLSLFLIFASCNKENETPPTEPIVLDAATLVEGTYTGTGNYSAPRINNPFTKVKILRLSETSIKVTSPESVFTEFIITDLIKNSEDNVYNNGTSSNIDFTKSTNGVIISHSDTYTGMTFTGSK